MFNKQRVSDQIKSVLIGREYEIRNHESFNSASALQAYIDDPIFKARVDKEVSLIMSIVNYEIDAMLAEEDK